MQAHYTKQQCRVAMKVTVGALGVAMLIPWFTTGSTYVTKLPSLLQQPQVITVCPDGPPRCQFAKIQEAIDAAPDPESPYWEPTAEIRVAPGTYEESLRLIHKIVLLKGAGKDLVFVRTAHRYQPVLLIAGAIGLTGALIEGFTFTGIIALAGGATGARILHNKVLGSVLVAGSLGGSVIIEENDFQKGDDQCGIFAIGVARMHIQRNILQDQCWIFIEQARLTIPLTQPPQAPGERILIESNRGGQMVIWDSSAITIQKNIIEGIALKNVEAVLVEENEVQVDGIEVESGSDVVIKKNVVEGNHRGILVSAAIRRKAAVTILENRVVQNEFGIATDELEYIVDCRGNEVRENKIGDYIVGWPTNPKPSPELKAKCERD